MIENFHDVHFPTDIALKASGGPTRRTEIVRMGSGREQRDQRWQSSLRTYEVGYGLKGIDALHEMISFFEARRGPLYGFRFRDPVDCKSCPPSQEIAPTDQAIGVGDGSGTDFQLIKRYGDETSGYVRVIEVPAIDTVQVAVDQETQQRGDAFEVLDRGLIRFAPDQIPAPGAQISAGYEFDVPVRFASDEATINLQSFGAGELPSIALQEIRL